MCKEQINDIKEVEKRPEEIDLTKNPIMRIEIFVVTTELAKDALLNNSINLKLCLEEQKIHLIKLFGGLTESDFKGYWINDKNQITQDFGKKFLIYTEMIQEPEDFSKLCVCFCCDITRKFNAILLQIKQITKQDKQAYTINNEIYFI